jgi:hypothetical protein
VSSAFRRRLAFAPLVVAAIAGLGMRPAGAGQPQSSGSATLILIDHASFEELLSIPQVRALAGVGGAALLSSPVPLRDALDAADLGTLPVRIVDLGSVQGTGGSVERTRLIAAGSAIEAALPRPARVGSRPELVIVATPSPSAAMARAKDDLTGIVIATAPGTSLADLVRSPASGGGSIPTLTSGSTRRSGVVASVDVVPTIESFLGRDVGDAATITRDPAAAPFDLHRRYLAYRRMAVPVQVGAAISLAIAGLFSVGVLALGDRAPVRLRRSGALASFSVLPLALALLLVGHLPALSYATVVPAIAVSTVAAAVAVGLLERRRGMTAAAGIAGLVVLGSLAAEAALGWTAALTPFLGGGELDGGRFYGLPNVDIGLLLGASVFVAAWIGTPLAGAAVIAGAGLLAGLPWTGSNLGGAITLFAGAGLWFAIRERGRLGFAEAGVGLVAAGAGMAAIIAVHRYLSTFPTHITYFAEGESGGLVGTVLHRLQVGVDLIAANPFALIPVAGVPVCLWIVLRPPGPIREGLERTPVWRQAILVILAASVVAYVANDSGAAALGLGFGTGLGALLFVSLLSRPAMMDA